LVPFVHFSFFIYLKIKIQYNLLGKSIVNVNGKVWRSEELPDDLLMDYYNIENNVYSKKKNFAEQLGLRIALAKEVGKNVNNQVGIPKLTEVLSIPPVNTEDARKYYDDTLKNFGSLAFSGQSFEKLKSQLMAQLNQQKINEFSNNKIEEYVANGKIKVLMDPPLALPPKVDLSLFPNRGNPNTNITFVSIVDYMDPRSREILPEVENIYKNYSSKINFVSVIYSLSQNGRGGAFAKGAYCAKEQGNEKFWNYNKISLETPIPTTEESAIFKDEKQLNNEVIDVAQTAKLDVVKFTICINSDGIKQTMQKVQNQLYSFNSFQGTPTFYLNRRPVRVSLKELDSKLKNELN
jgi:protein-disulfide isomerase